jgi:hypothetical protein
MIDGTEVEVLEETATRAIVRVVHVRDDGEPFFGAPFLVNINDVFDEPPVEKVHAEITELRRKAGELRGEIAALNLELSATKQQRVSLSKHPSLDLLEDAIEGRLTHYVIVPDYSAPQIIEVAKSHVDDTNNHWSRDMNLRLLSLLGKPGKDLWWGLNKYSDGSGSYEQVFPVTSLEKAVEKLQVVIDGKITKAMESGGRHLESMIAVADKYGCTIPDRAREIVRERKIADAERRVSDARQSLEKSEAALKAITEDAPDAQ